MGGSTKLRPLLPPVAFGEHTLNRLAFILGIPLMLDKTPEVLDDSPSLASTLPRSAISVAVWLTDTGESWFGEGERSEAIECPSDLLSIADGLPVLSSVAERGGGRLCGGVG